MSFLETWIVPPQATVGAWAYILTAIIAVTMVAASKGGFGGGAGVISVPLMLQIARADFVVGAWLPVLVACDVVTVRNYPKAWSWAAVRQLVPGMTVGILLATVFLSMASSNPKLFGALLQAGVGLISLVFVILQAPAFFRGERAAAAPAEATAAPPDAPLAEVAQPASPAPGAVPAAGAGWTPTWIVSLPVGFLIGVTTMIAHAAGPISTMYILPQKLDQRTFAGTIGWTFFVVNLSKVPFTILAGAMTWETLRYGLWMMLIAPLGVWLGVWLNRRLSPTVFLRLIYVFLVVAAIKLLSDAAITFSQTQAFS
jgi:uncharacterized membrane protein YfcA